MTSIGVLDHSFTVSCVRAEYGSDTPILVGGRKKREKKRRDLIKTERVASYRLTQHANKT